MDRHDRQHLIDKRLQALRVVAAALTGSIVMYMVLAWVLLQAVILDPIVELAPAVTYTIMSAGVAVMLSGYIVGRLLRAAAGNAGGATAAHAAGRTDSSRLDAMLAGYTRAFVIGATAREGAATVGFVLALLIAEPWPAWVLGGLAVGSMLVHWPRAGDIDDWLFQQPRIG